MAAEVEGRGLTCPEEVGPVLGGHWGPSGQGLWEPRAPRRAGLRTPRARVFTGHSRRVTGPGAAASKRTEGSRGCL